MDWFRALSAAIIRARRPVLTRMKRRKTTGEHNDGQPWTTCTHLDRFAGFSLLKALRALASCKQVGAIKRPIELKQRNERP
jgi:hypothetical protein